MVGLPWTLPLVERCVLAQPNYCCIISPKSVRHVSRTIAHQGSAYPLILWDMCIDSWVQRSGLYDAVFVPEINRNYVLLPVE